MSLLLFALLLLVFSALLCLLLSLNERSAGLVLADFSFASLHLPVLLALGGAVLGLLSLLPFCVTAIYRGASGSYIEFLRAWFLLPIIFVGILSALHSPAYLDAGYSCLRRGLYWFFFNLMLATMLLVTWVSQPIVFLLAWEGMGLFSFALVLFEYRHKDNLRAAWIYFLACQAGGALLMLMFLLRTQAESYPLFFFISGLLGFGLKAGLPVLHIWLPEAHPVAPAPVSALLSAGMINLGFYGILRWLLLPGLVSLPLLGYSLLICGMLGALLGIFFAIPQKNLKRLLAYSSVENMGLIACGLGYGFLSLHWQRADLALLSFAAAGLHILGHALHKGNLFLLSGNVYKSCHELSLDRLGGLQKRLPGSGCAFMLSALALSGLPPGNIFMAEILLYVAAARGIASGSLLIATLSLALFLTLAFCGALAATVFSKAGAAVFLGEPRSPAARKSHAIPALMKHCAFAFLGLSLILLCLSPFLASRLAQVFAGQSGLLWPDDLLDNFCMPAFNEHLLNTLLGFSLFFVVLLFMLFCIRRRHLPYSRREAPRRFTWDCGFAQPTARMQYTGSAFVQPLVYLFAPLLRPMRNILAPKGLFPKKASYELSCRDGGEQLFWRPLMNFTVRLAIFSHRLQSGHLHLYVLLMILGLLALFIWGFAL